MPKPNFYKMPKEKRNRLLKAALNEFSNKGYSKGSQNQIIKKAGFSKPSLYYYLGGKADLFAAVVTEVVNELYHIVSEQLVCLTPEEYWENLRIALVKIMGFRFDKKYHRIFRDFNDPSIKEEISPYLKDVEKIASSWAMEIIKTGLEVKAFQKIVPVNLMAQLLRSTIETLEEWISLRLDFIKEEEKDDISNAYLEVIHALLDPLHKVNPKKVQIFQVIEERRLSITI